MIVLRRAVKHLCLFDSNSIYAGGFYKLCEAVCERGEFSIKTLQDCSHSLHALLWKGSAIAVPLHVGPPEGTLRQNTTAPGRFCDAGLSCCSFFWLDRSICKDAAAVTVSERYAKIRRSKKGTLYPADCVFGPSTDRDSIPSAKMSGRLLPDERCLGGVQEIHAEYTNMRHKLLKSKPKVSGNWPLTLAAAASQSIRSCCRWVLTSMMP